jgi:SPW repeat
MAYQETSQMNRQLNRPRAHWHDWLNAVLAVWLFVSPWVLNFGGVVDGGVGTTAAIAMTAAWNAWVLSVIVFVLAITAARQLGSGPEWLNVLLGAWIFIAPWVLGFVGFPAAAWDHWIVGAAIAIVGFLGLSTTSSTTTGSGTAVR